LQLLVAQKSLTDNGSTSAPKLGKPRGPDKKDVIKYEKNTKKLYFSLDLLQVGGIL